MTRRRLLPALALAAASAVLAGCGGDGTTDEDAITKIVLDGGRDPATICAHLSDPLLERFGSVARCRRAAAKERSGAAATVRIDRLTVDGDAATADVTGADGRTRITFVKDEGSWKVAGTRPRGG